MREQGGLFDGQEDTCISKQSIKHSGTGSCTTPIIEEEEHALWVAIAGREAIHPSATGRQLP